MKRVVRRTYLSLSLLMLLAACATPPMPKDPPESLATLVGERRSLRLTPRQLAVAPQSSTEVAPALVVNDENSIFFDIASTELSNEEKAKLLRHAARLKADEKLTVVLLGHCDDLGSISFNLAIAERRAEAVYRLLRSSGVPATQLRRYTVRVEKGDSRSCQSQSCRDKTHRVELVFSSTFS